MVFHKRLGYRFNGYQVPTMPRGSRSARGKRSARMKVEENQMCAFELLATVAGKLLLEKENSTTPSHTITGGCTPTFSKSNIKEEQHDELKSYKVGFCDQGNCNHQASKIGFQRTAQVCTFNERRRPVSGVDFCPHSIVVKTDPSEKITSAEKVTFQKSKSELSNCLNPAQGKFSSERHAPVSAVLHQRKVEDGIPTPPQFEHQKTKNGIRGNVIGTCCFEDLMELDIKPPPLVSSDEVPVHGDLVPRSSSFPKCGSDVEFGVDDDEKSSSVCTQPCNVTSKYLRPQRIGDRRIRKLLASKFWKVGPTFVKDWKLSKTDEDGKSISFGRQMYYMRRRTQKSSFMRRKLFERGSLLTSKRTINCEGISCSPEMAIKGEASSSAARSHGGNGMASSFADQKISFESEDYHVKLSIKSFKVPELFIEIPETATVGSLKKTVLEAVTAILDSGLRIGVLLQGRKVRDDNKTLLQAGISHSDKPDSVGFTLEPNPSHAPKQLTTNTEETQFLPVCNAPEPLRRLTAIPASDPAMVESSTNPPPPSTSGNCVESDHDSDPSSPNATASVEDDSPNSKALVAVHAMNVEALAAVPKSRRSDMGQRRIRRPFSVSEVEALVQAVEKLGTGRWRDVKLRSFDDANHRTYVDLKDKWKTLVHTARISPQRRRGEPVPQDLLDRVLSAHAYWSQQQARLQVKQQLLEPCPLA
uniref:Telomere repeat-binding protein 5 n=1 Tax=Anthurium amnicola TaxID=1678845 RepID=A0A1D1ZJ31_9ARAE